MTDIPGLHNVLQGRSFQAGPELKPRNWLADQARQYGLHGLSNRLNDPSSGAGLAVDAVGGLANALVLEPTRSFSNMLANPYQRGAGDSQFVDDAFNVAGGAMLGGMAAPRPRNSVGVSGRPGMDNLLGVAQTKLMSPDSEKFLTKIANTKQPNMLMVLGYELQDLSVADAEKAMLKAALAEAQKRGIRSAADDAAAAGAEAKASIAPPDSGKTYRLYHGANKDLGEPEIGFRWFTTDRNHAGSFGDVSEYSTSFNRPAYLDAKAVDHPSGRSGDEWLYNYAKPLFDQGHDALFVRGWEGDGMVVLVRGDISDKKMRPGDI